MSRLDMTKALHRACVLLNVDISLLNTKTRKRPVVEANRLFSYFMREYFKLTTVEIGNFLEKDHSTIVYLHRTFREFIETKESICMELLSDYEKMNQDLLKKYLQ